MVLSAGAVVRSTGVVVLLAGVSVMSVDEVLSVGDAALFVGVSLLLFADVGVLASCWRWVWGHDTSIIIFLTLTTCFSFYPARS